MVWLELSAQLALLFMRSLPPINFIINTILAAFYVISSTFLTHCTFGYTRPHRTSQSKIAVHYIPRDVPFTVTVLIVHPDVEF